MQAHFRAHPVERLGEKMSGAHPGLQRAERMFHRLTADAHHLRIVGHARAGAMKNGDDFTIGLCRVHHDELHSWGDEQLFLDFHGVDYEAILAKLR